MTRPRKVRYPAIMAVIWMPLRRLPESMAAMARRVSPIMASQMAVRESTVGGSSWMGEVVRL